MFAKAHEYPRLGGKRKGEIVSGYQKWIRTCPEMYISADESNRTKQELIS